ncbi:hypothetical protein BK140_08395 [Paenibacillus macerans]|nr:hypothetical protein BK140_08395 [Paenibacillus macerans]
MKCTFAFDGMGYFRDFVIVHNFAKCICDFRKRMDRIKTKLLIYLWYKLPTGMRFWFLKDFYKKAWFWVIVACLVVGFIGRWIGELAPAVLIFVITIIIIGFKQSNKKKKEAAMGIIASFSGRHIRGLPLSSGHSVRANLLTDAIIFVGKGFTGEIKAGQIKNVVAMSYNEYVQTQRGMGHANVAIPSNTAGTFLVIHYVNSTGFLDSVVLRGSPTGAVGFAQSAGRSSSSHIVNL